MRVLTDNLVLADDITGYADISGTLGFLPVVSPHPDPTRLGSVQMEIQLASFRLNWEPGTGEDLTKATVTMTSNYGSETLGRKTTVPMIRPGWEIVEKGGMLPGLQANENDILEPNEVFTVFVYPSRPLPPGTSFSVVLSMPDQRSLTVSRTVPVPVTPVMNLG